VKIKQNEIYGKNPTKEGSISATTQHHSSLYNKMCWSITPTHVDWEWDHRW